MIAAMASDWLNVFNHNPPSLDLAEKLFCNRARELRTGLAKLKGCPPTESMLAVSGPTRSGKSHFVQVLLKQLETHEPRYQRVVINANNLGSPRRALVQVFHAVFRSLKERKNVPVRSQSAFEKARDKHEERLQRITGAYAERADEESSGASSQKEDSVEFRLGLGAKSGARVKTPASEVEASKDASAGLTARHGTRAEERSGHSTRTTMRTPGDPEIVDMIGEVLDDLAQFDADRRTLLFVDDIDLLDREGREGSEPSQRFLDHLRPIAAHSRAAVLVTLREAVFCERDKDFQPLVEIGFMEENNLREIYQRHVEVYLEGRGVFDDDVLDALIGTADGRVGVFLRECHGLVTHNLPEEGARLSRDDLRGFYRHRLSQWRQGAATMHLIPPIERAVEAGAFQVTLDDVLGDNPLRFVMLSPIPGDPKGYTINPIWADALRAQKSRR